MTRRLPIDNLDARHRGVTRGKALSFYEAATVCLNRFHDSPADFSVENRAVSSLATVVWERPDARVQGAHANQIDATEEGAYACVLAAVELEEGLVAVRRAETGTGADYYVGRPDQGRDDLEDCLRLEVSGSDAADAVDIKRRLREKVQQAARGKSNLPAKAGVVGFQARLILLRDVKHL